MSTTSEFKFSINTLLFPLVFTLGIWIVFWFEVRFGFDFNFLGIRPRNVTGLRGILFSPFIHSSMSHLWHNTLPVLILSTALFYFYQQIAWKVLLWGFLLTGLITWGIARPSLHIGASGMIYFLSSFLFFKGIWSKHYRLIALALIVIFVYGSLIWGTLPDAVPENVSWEGHLSGLIAGIILALVFRMSIAKPKRYAWEDPTYNEQEDVFMKHFDDDGNFVEQVDEPEENEDEEGGAYRIEDQKVNYIYRKSTSKDSESDQKRS